MAEEMKSLRGPGVLPGAGRGPAHSRLKGSKKLDGLGLVVLERLVEWRDRWAKSRNRPIRALMRDDVLVEIARRRPQQESRPGGDARLSAGAEPEGDPRAAGPDRGGRETPKSEWPTPFEQRDESPMTMALLDLLSAVTQAICHEEKLSRNLLGGTQRLRELLDFHDGQLTERPALLRGWREEFMGRRLIELLEGRSEIHLSGWPKKPRIAVVAHPPAKKKPQLQADAS